MKKTIFNQEIHTLSAQELVNKLDELRRQLFELRLNKLTAHIKDYSQFNTLRKNIARVQTRIQQLDVQ